MKFVVSRYDLEGSAQGVEIAIPGFKAAAGDGSETPAQVFLEVYNNKLRVHVWNGDEDPIATVEVDAL